MLTKTKNLLAFYLPRDAKFTTSVCFRMFYVCIRYSIVCTKKNVNISNTSFMLQANMVFNGILLLDNYYE